MARLIIKLGGGLITDKSKPFSLRQETLTKLAEEISILYKSGAQLIIGNGAGSFGHFVAQKIKYKSSPADPHKITELHDSVVRLNRHVVETLQAHGIPAVSFAPMAFMHESKGAVQCDLSPFQKILDCGAVPVVFGDVIMLHNGSSRIISTEEVFGVIGSGQHKKFDACIYLTSPMGVLTKDNKTIPRLTPNDVVHEHSHTNYDVTGSMLQKVAAGFKALEYSEQVFITSGSVTGELIKALAGQTSGTELLSNR